MKENKKTKTKTNKEQEKVMEPILDTNKDMVPRPLCFTVSYKRPYHLYNCINSILSQSYKDITYSVHINIDHNTEKALYNELLKPFLEDPRLKVSFGRNDEQHSNYLKPIKELSNSLNHHNLFIKIDDDDIYYTNYISSIIDVYQSSKVDILSCIINKRVNNDSIELGKYESIGVWQPDVDSKTKFGMPFTYVFNRKALDIILKLKNEDTKKIHFFEDPAWRTKWREAKLKSKVIKNFDNAIYHIHGKNSSSSYLMKPSTPLSNSTDKPFEFLENEYFCVCMVQHTHWASYVYLNKRNNRMYNITNDDHGAFDVNEDKLKISWDNWGEEMFKKVSMNNDSYYYVSDN